MSLADITRTTILEAIAEHDRLGQHAFLKRYGFAPSRSYFLLHNESRYDSKAIAGAAHGYLPGRRPLAASEFSGGDKTVKAKLESLGFEVETPSPRNPPWSRDELILALELYFRHRPDHISKTHPEVTRLSALLNELPLQPSRPDAVRFRNPNGVYMKLCNFLRFDPTYSGKGLAAGGRDEEKVWNEFATNREELRAVAGAIAAGRSAPLVVEAAGTDDDDEDALDFPEGRILYRLHRSRERSAALRARVVKAALRVHKALACEACGFNFKERYGEIGDGYIECHHTRPVSELKAGAKTRIEDIALLCSNCHRMVHRRRPWLDVNALARLMSRPGSASRAVPEP